MAGSISVGGKVIATHTGPKGAGTVDLDVNKLKLIPGSRPSSPTQGDMYLDSSDGRLKVYNGTIWSFFEENDGSTISRAASSAQSLLDIGITASGVYWINWGGTEYQIYCEQQLEGGGWMMILNYLHLGGTNPTLNTRTSSFPLLGSDTLGTDESGSTYWGHISNSLANAYDWSEYMFFAKTEFHSRIIHFRGNNSNIVSYIKTGSGSMSPYYADGTTNFNGSLYNNASIPLNISADGLSGYTDSGDSAMTEFPMYGNSDIGNPRAHWGIKGSGNRWEVDDHPAQQGGSDGGSSTLHRVWVR